MGNKSEPDFAKIRPVKVRTKLSKPLGDAFSFISNPCNDPKWVDTTPKVSQTDGNGPVVGAEYQFEQTVIRDVEGKIVITDIAAPSFISFRVEDPFRIYRVEYRLRDVKGGCVLEQSSYPWFKSTKLRRKTWLARFMIRKQLRKQMRALQAAIMET